MAELFLIVDGVERITAVICNGLSLGSRRATSSADRCHRSRSSVSRGLAGRTPRLDHPLRPCPDNRILARHCPSNRLRPRSSDMYGSRSVSAIRPSIVGAAAGVSAIPAADGAARYDGDRRGHGWFGLPPIARRFMPRVADSLPRWHNPVWGRARSCRQTVSGSRFRSRRR